MKVKIATWNMAYWSHKKYFEKAGDYLITIPLSRDTGIGGFISHCGKL